MLTQAQTTSETISISKVVIFEVDGDLEIIELKGLSRPCFAKNEKPSLPSLMEFMGLRVGAGATLASTGYGI
jgi:hypothetical protein